MSKQTHTKTPWSIRTCKAGNSAITNKQYYDHILEPLNCLIERNDEEFSANAHHIMKCVNSHDELVEALKGCIIALEKIEIKGISKGRLEIAKQALQKAESVE